MGSLKKKKNEAHTPRISCPLKWIESGFWLAAPNGVDDMKKADENG